MRLLGPLPQDVLEVVAEMTGYSVDQLNTTHGVLRLQQARKVAFWAAMQFGATYEEVARATSRTHWTVRTAVAGIERDSSLKALAIEVANEVQARYGGLTSTVNVDSIAGCDTYVDCASVCNCGDE